ncbi:ABC transporter permease [Georgenia wangjunii]|uniref:ABC transporter permease n=1 Tax=Georgenia wangjunii TaxID=3117730 RepID=UPI002F25EDC3
MSAQRTPAKARGTGNLATIWLVARREFKARFLTKSNIISLVILAVVIVVGIGAMNYFMEREGDGAAAFTVAVDTETGVLEEPLTSAAATLGTSVDVVTMDRAEAETALVEDVDAFLTGEPAAPEMLVEEDADPELLGVVTSAVQAHALTVEIEDLGGDPSTVGQALAGAVPSVTSLDPDEAGGMFGPAYFVSILMISVLLFVLISTGSIIAMGVVEEKTSRVVEILLATIKPAQLLAGKILGIGLVGLVQVVLLGGSATLAMMATGLMDGFEIDLSATMLMTLLWFLLGYAIFALLFGGFAALVSRQEEIGAVTTPLMFLLFVPYYASMFLVPEQPDSTLVRVLSQVPIFSPFMMPMRTGFGAVEGWEVALAVAIALVTIPLLVWIGAKVYKRGVLHTGGRMKLTEALRG